MGILFVLVMVGSVAGVVLWHATRRSQAARAQVEAFRRGDYRAQIHLAEAQSQKRETAETLFYRASACLQLGRLPEAEKLIRESIALEKHALLQTVARDELGRVLMAQERWDEAARCFREVIRGRPSCGAGHRAMAELLLRSGGDAEAALAEASLAVSKDRLRPAGRSKLQQEDRNTSLGESLAVLAWAVAANGGKASEADSLIQEARGLCHGDKPIQAEVGYFAGQAYRELGRGDDGAREFRQAVEIDPDGLYGRLSRTAARAA